MALATLRRILADQPVVVLGSAPLTGEPGLLLDSPVRLICVNGSIGTAPRSPDIWVLNSRCYDDQLWNNPKKWPQERKMLHAAMMAQAAGQATRHLVLLQKSTTSAQTIAALRSLHATWRGATDLHPGMKMNLGKKAGIRSFTTASNISAGVFAACLALLFGKGSVTLTGFSYTEGHSYLPTATNHRFHVEQDQEAIADLMQRHGTRLRITSLTDI